MIKPIEAYRMNNHAHTFMMCHESDVRELESYTAQREKKLEALEIGLEEEMSHVDRLLNIPKHETVEEWISVKDRLPIEGMSVNAYYVNQYKNGRIIRAKYIRKHSDEYYDIDGCGDIGSDYSEELDCYYYPEGWYEQMDNWNEYSSCLVVEGEVSHWQPLPEPPEETE